MIERYFQTIVDDLSKSINQFLQMRPCMLIGIDGCGGSGKTTLASELLNALNNVQIVHMDDFYLPSDKRMSMADPKSVGWQFDWKRMEREVLKPIDSGQLIRYQQYDWQKDHLAEWREFQPLGVIIVEGIFTLRKELSKYYHTRLWVDCPREERLRRGLMRDGEEARLQWEHDWMMEEDRYITEHVPQLSADKIISGMPSQPGRPRDGTQPGNCFWRKCCL